MRKKIILLPLSVFATVIGFAQQTTQAVIATAGDISRTANMTLHWTVGEPVIETALAKNHLLTQGFHQPILFSKHRRLLVTSPPELITVMVTPNPVQHTCRVFLTKKTSTIFFLELSDILGRKLYTTTAAGMVATIDLNLAGYASGTYLLSVRDAKGLLFKTSKIIKTN